jgi:AcrR family transcriptional regulator
VSVPISSDPRPLRADAERNRRRLLEAASELFAARGLGVGLDEIARHAGVGVGTAYRRFRDKEALIEALFEDRIAGIAALARQAREHEDPWEGLVEFMEGAVRTQVADRGLKEVLFGSGYGASATEQARRTIAPRIEEIVRRAQGDGRLRADVEVTDLPVLQFVISGVADFGPDLAGRYLTLLLDGLRTPEPSPLPVRALSPDELQRAIRDGV